jgi:hypothetical protein
MNVSYEYILAGFVIILVLSTTQVYTTQLLARKIGDWEQAAGYDASESFLDMLILSPGEPSNWGDLPGNPQRLGLASINVFEEYSLDPAKVERLTPNSSNYITPSTLRSLMGISSTTGLSLRIVPALNITIAYQAPGNYSVTVRDLKGLTVPNVNVTGYYFSAPFNPYLEPSTLKKITDTTGTAPLSYEPKANATLLVCVGQSDILSLSAYPKDVLLTLTVQGNHVVSSSRSTTMTVNATTGSLFGYDTQVTSRYVKLEGYTYYMELMLWN